MSVPADMLEAGTAGQPVESTPRGGTLEEGIGYDVDPGAIAELLSGIGEGDPASDSLPETPAGGSDSLPSPPAGASTGDEPPTPTADDAGPVSDDTTDTDDVPSNVNQIVPLSRLNQVIKQRNEAKKALGDYGPFLAELNKIPGATATEKVNNFLAALEHQARQKLQAESSGDGYGDDYPQRNAPPPQPMFQVSAPVEQEAESQEALETQVAELETRETQAAVKADLALIRANDVEFDQACQTQVLSLMATGDTRPVKDIAASVLQEKKRIGQEAIDGYLRGKGQTAATHRTIQRSGPPPQGGEPNLDQVVRTLGKNQRIEAATRMLQQGEGQLS